MRAARWLLGTTCLGAACVAVLSAVSLEPGRSERAERAERAIGAAIAPEPAKGLARGAGPSARSSSSAPTRRRVALAELVPRPSPGYETAQPDWELLRAERDGARIAERYASGQLIYEGEQVLDGDGRWVRHGPWSAYYEDGSPWERGAYADGVEDGRWDWWYENGQPMSAGAFRDGVRVGPWSWWYPDGRLMMTGTHDENGVGCGRWTYWHANGIQAAEGRMVDGELGGRWLVWGEDGVLDARASGLYEAGERIAE